MVSSALHESLEIVYLNLAGCEPIIRRTKAVDEGWRGGYAVLGGRAEHRFVITRHRPWSQWAAEAHYS